MTCASFIASWELKPTLPLWLAGTLIVFTIIGMLAFHKGQSAVGNKRTGRILVALRTFLALTVLTLLVAPTHISTHNRHTHGKLLLLLDDSRSMAWSPSPQSPTRAAIADRALDQLHSTLDNFDVTVLPLSAARILTPAKEGWRETTRSILQNPSAANTAIGNALQRVAEQTSTPQTILLISDGRQNFGQSAEPAAHTLISHGSRLITLCIGPTQTIRDAVIDAIEAPDSIFVGDDLPITATIRLDAVDPTESVTATLTRDGQQLATKPVQPSPQSRIDFVDTSAPPGQHTYEISLPPLRNEATIANNKLSTKVSVIQDKIKVLLVEDEPRWEYQFLNNQLRADHRISLQSALLQPARIENVAAPEPPPLPVTSAEYSKFDVVILGDLPPTRFNAQQQSNLATALREGKPKALIILAGLRNMPARYAATPLANLLPIDLSNSPWTASEMAEQRRLGFQPTIAPPASDSILTRFSPDDRTNFALWSAIPNWFAHTPYTTPRPGATVYWQIAEPPSFPLSPRERAGVREDDEQPSSPRSSDPLSIREKLAELATARERAEVREDDKQRPPQHSLLSSIHYGADRVLYLASPETWRLRHIQTPDGRAQDLHQIFWRQALRWAIAGEPAPDNSSTNLEDRNLNSDPAAMAAIASSGSNSTGSSFDDSQIPSLVAALPTEDHIEPITTRLGLFENPSAPSTRFIHWTVFLIFITVITTEWIIRKRRGLI